MNRLEITPCFVELPHRGLIKVGGEDAFKFLQNIITNDLAKLETVPTLHACLLTAQGKFLHDFFVTRKNQEFWLDCEGGERAKHLMKMLTLYRLRSKVILELREQNQVFGVLTDNHTIGGRSFERPDFAQAGFEIWDRLRISLSIPDGSRDAEIEKSTLAELNLEDSIDYQKGCYIGQELTARIHHRGLAKKHLFPMKFTAPAPVYGTPLTYNGKTIGEMRSSQGETGLALLKDEALPPRENGFYMLDIGN